MPRKLRPKVDPVECEMESALAPGAYITDHACFSFVDDVEKVAATISKLIRKEPARAAALYETFLAGCYEKAEEIDDSSGCFGQFAAELYSGWIRARQADGADPDEIASRLLHAMDDDPYGFCNNLEKVAAKALDKAGLAAFVLQVRARFDGTAKTDGTRKDRPEYVRSRWGDVLRTLYIAQRKLDAYVAVAKETGLTPQDCQAIARLLVSRRKADDALGWVKRGRGLDNKTSHGSWVGDELVKLEREILLKLGRGTEALDSAWADYCKHPSKYAYDELMTFVPKAERAKWHEKAIEAGRAADLHAFMELLLETRELERLADLIRKVEDQALEALSHYATEPVARVLEKAHPDLAARLWRAQGMRIVGAGKSKYYRAALSNFENAKRCFERAGLAAAWEKTAAQVRADHHRKAGFMPGFNALVAGSGPSDEPSFLERAKTRWKAREPGKDA